MEGDPDSIRNKTAPVFSRPRTFFFVTANGTMMSQGGRSKFELDQFRLKNSGYREGLFK